MAEKSKKSIKVLIVEDDPDQVMLYSTKLTIEGVEVVAADNRAEAMRYLLGDGFDLVLLDILLRQENGLDILKSIRQNEKTKRLPVAVFTNYTKKEVQDEAEKLGVVDFIVKSEITPKQVAERIKEIVSRARASEKSA